MTASTKAKPTAAKSSSRRALLAGALGGIGAVAAGAVGRVSPVRGANNDPVLVGNNHTGTSTTQISNSTTDAVVFYVDNTAGGSGGGLLANVTGGGYGVYAASQSGPAVEANSNSGIGVEASSSLSHGVRAFTGPNGASGVLGTVSFYPTTQPNTGVHGHSSTGRGVYGETSSGVGVFGATTSGYAFRGSGRVRFDKVSGVKTIPAGSTTATVSPGVNVTAASFVLLTPKTNIGSRGLWFTTQPSADTFKIRMSSARSSNTRVAWLLLR